MGRLVGAQGLGGEVVGAQEWWGPMNYCFAKKGMQFQWW